MSEASDAAIVARVLAGNRQEFGTLVARYQDRILAYLRHMGLNEADAWDVAQDTFVRGFRHLRRCKEPDRFAGWLFRIAVNVSRTAGKRNARRAVESLDAYPTPLTSEEPGPHESAEASITRERVRAALEKLAADQREALVLMYIMGHSVSEIEELTGASASAVKMRLKRGREALRDQLASVFTEVYER